MCFSCVESSRNVVSQQYLILPLLPPPTLPPCHWYRNLRVFPSSVHVHTSSAMAYFVYLIAYLFRRVGNVSLRRRYRRFASTVASCLRRCWSTLMIEYCSWLLPAMTCKSKKRRKYRNETNCTSFTPCCSLACKFRCLWPLLIRTLRSLVACVVIFAGGAVVSLAGFLWPGFL